MREVVFVVADTPKERFGWENYAHDFLLAESKVRNRAMAWVVAVNRAGLKLGGQAISIWYSQHPKELYSWSKLLPERELPRRYTIEARHSLYGAIAYAPRISGGSSTLDAACLAHDLFSPDEVVVCNAELDPRGPYKRYARVWAEKLEEIKALNIKGTSGLPLELLGAPEWF